MRLAKPQCLVVQLQGLVIDKGRSRRPEYEVLNDVK